MIVVRAYGVSVDGFAAGPDQSLEHPLGVRGEELMQWFFPTRAFQTRHGKGEGEAGIDNGIAEDGFRNVGAWIIGRNMFGPIRGPWPDDQWKGWWGDEPPYHVPVFVLTHFARPPLTMQGGTTFHFVTEGARVAIDLARAAGGGRDVRIGGGAATVREYLQAGLIDEMHLAVSPVLLGRGEALFAGLDLAALGYAITRSVAGERATHVFVGRR
jgi:dihydrofolate reductase